ncbi:MAG: hypothetical protein K2W82_14100 [Candidatus Obscuribacterales bacterium]|nr:hypothetical protein [Candidatus Obscuribacterales bacterium]
MKKALVFLAALSTMSLPAFSQACGDEGRYFHLQPPDYSISSHRRHAIHRMAKALRWYKEHNGDKQLCINGKPQ